MMHPMPALADGRYSREALSRRVYDALTDRVNISTLKEMKRSPRHYKYRIENPQEDKPQFLFGRAVHVATLEPERFATDIAIFDGAVRRGKDWEACRAKYAETDILKAAEVEEVLAIAASVRANPQAAEILAARVWEGRTYAGAPESSLLWTDAASGIQCKGRTDWQSAHDSMADLKSTTDASPEAFMAQAWKYGYGAQAAFYCDGMFALYEARVPYYLVAVEKSAPYVTQVYEVPPQMLDMGRHQYRAWLKRVSDCRLSGVWPGYSDKIEALGIPRWADQSQEAPDESDGE